MSALIVIFVLLAFGSFAGAEEMIFPGAAWEEATPLSQGLDPVKLAKAAARLEASTGRDKARERVIIVNGRLVWKGDNIDHVHGVWSCTKSFTSTTLGLLIADGKCSLGTRAASVLPEMKASYSRVTLRHFTTMTSGYHAVGDETTGSYTHGPSSTPFQPDPKPLFAPGGAYACWDSAMNQFGRALTVIAGEPLDELFKRRVADPIGMNPAAWKWGDYGKDHSPRINGGSGNGGKDTDLGPRVRAFWSADAELWAVEQAAAGRGGLDSPGDRGSGAGNHEERMAEERHRRPRPVWLQLVAQWRGCRRREDVARRARGHFRRGGLQQQQALRHRHVPCRQAMTTSKTILKNEPS